MLFSPLFFTAALTLFAPLLHNVPPASAQTLRENAPAITAKAAVTKPAGADYVNGRQMSRLNHWRRFPIKVYFDTGAAYTPERQQQAQAGFDAWPAATDNILAYVVTDEEREADITVKFLPVAYIGKGSRTIGETGTLVRRSGALFRARIELAVANMGPRLLTEAASHEFGHALGINGHSDDPDDLMFASARRLYRYGGDAEPKGPSERDINTIKRAYPDLFHGE